MQRPRGAAGDRCRDLKGLGEPHRQLCADRIAESTWGERERVRVQHPPAAGHLGGECRALASQHVREWL